jgi:hypothetical protein
LKLRRKVWLFWCRVMPFDPEREALLEAAIAKIPKLASMIATMPISKHAEALRIAERSYRQTAAVLELGEQGEHWVSAVMERLQIETKWISLETQQLLRTLFHEVERLGIS